MRRPRWIVTPPAASGEPVAGSERIGGATPGADLSGFSKPVVYHCISRAVDRRYVFGPDEKEKLRKFMRMYEGFSGNRILSYCFMSNHIHLLLEITPRPVGGLSDEELLARLRHIQSDAQVAMVAKELAEARKAVVEGRATHGEAYGQAIHERFTWRMHDLSQFMQGFLQRYTLWHNARHKRSGYLWEARFKSVIVESGIASRTIAAYIDLNPVRAGVVTDPADYRWSSYGEAIGGGAESGGKKARAGLVRAVRAHLGVSADDAFWENDVALEYRNFLLLGAGEMVEERLERGGKMRRIQKRKGMSAEELAAARAKLREAEEQRVSELRYGKMLRCRLRYFTDGAVIGSREFVNAAFEAARDRFGGKRRDGARKLRGAAQAAAGVLWSLRDLRNV